VCLDKIVEEARSNGSLDAESANTAIDFFSNFADGCHHAKEEDRLFVEMEQSGVPRDGGPIGVMLYEHDEGRSSVRGMAEAVNAAASGDVNAISEFAAHANSFIGLLSAHIQKEDQILFPMADNILAAEADNLLADFRRIEADAGGKRHTDYILKARGLCEKYQVPFVESTHIATLTEEFTS